MSPDQIGHIRSTWALMLASRDDVAEAFYNRLFEIDPGVKPLFANSDMRAQGDKLVQTLAVVVKGVDDLPRLIPALQALGRRHVGYGVTDAHYASVGAALIWTFNSVLGENFPAAAQESWTTAFGVLSQVMIEATRQAA